MSDVSGIALATCLLAASTMLLTGCSENWGDRETGARQTADEFHDVTRVVIWRNADQVPNVAFFCADARAWVATLNSGQGRGQLLRDPDKDRGCVK